MDEAPPAPPPSPWPARAAAAAALAAGCAVLTPELGGMGGDNADYVLLSRSLAGGAYETTWGAGPPTPHTLYPPLFPLLLLPFSGAAPGSFLGCHLPGLLLGAGAVLLLARLFERRGLPPVPAAAAALAPALSFFWLQNAADVLSELPFLFFVAAALLAREAPGDGPLPRARILGTAAAAAAAFLVRTAGLALVIPVAASLLLDRRTRGRDAVLAVAGMGAVVGGWFLHGAVAGDGGYGSQLAAGEGGLLARAWEGLTGFYLPGLATFLLPRAGGAWTAAAWILGLAAAVAAGARLRGHRCAALPEAFFLVYLAMQAAWPFREPRFVLPLAALLPLLALEGFRAALSRAPAAAAARAVLALGLLLPLPNLERYLTLVLPRASRARPAEAPGRHEPAAFGHTWGRDDGKFAAEGVALASWLHACDLLREGIPGAPPLPPGPVLALNPRIAALLTGRGAVVLEAGAAPEAVDALLREAGVAVVLVDGFGGARAEAIRRWRAAREGRVEVLLRLPGGVEAVRPLP